MAPRFDFFIERQLHFSVHASVASLGEKAEYALAPGQYEQLFSDIFERYLKVCKSIKVSTFDQYCKGVACNNGAVCTFRDCFGMFLVIDPVGDIYPCQRFAGKAEYSLGNIADAPSMDDIVHSAAAKGFLQRESAIREQCGECAHYAYCRGGCAYNSMAGNGKADLRDPYCDAYKNIFSMIQKKIRDEITSEENIEAISKLGPCETGNPLMRKGPITELVRENAHPISLQEHTVDTNLKCKRCNYRYICGGVCKAWGEESSHYNLDAEPMDCSGSKKRAEKLYAAAKEYVLT